MEGVGRAVVDSKETPLTLAELRELEILLAQHPQRAEKPILHGSFRCVRELIALREPDQEVIDDYEAVVDCYERLMNEHGKLQARHDRLREAVKDARGQDSPHVIHKILDAVLAEEGK